MLLRVGAFTYAAKALEPGMEIRGWDDCPDNFQTDFNFDKGPKWLLALAHTPFLEKYAYPRAIDLGLAEVWPDAKGAVLNPFFNCEGWIIHDNPKNDLERWIEGSLAHLQHDRTSPLMRFLLRHRKIDFSERVVVFWQVLPRITFTRFGSKMRMRHDIHRMNGTFEEYKLALRGERFNFSG